MAADASYALQQAIKAKVETAVSPVPVYDDVPPGAAMPYLLVGDDTAVDAGAKDKAGQEFSVTIHAWSMARGRQHAKELLGLVYAALHQQALTVTGFAVAQVRFEFADSFVEEIDERHTATHAIHRYRIKLTEA